MNTSKKLALLLLLPLYFCLASNAMAQASNANKQMTAQGDTVWVVINHVKPDKKAQFEQFVYEVFWPTAKKLDKKAQRAFDNTRVLNPAQAEEDGTFTYVFLMDPVISGEDYSIENLLGKMYPKDKAEEYYRMFEESLAREGEHYAVVQSKYWGAPAKKGKGNSKN